MYIFICTQDSHPERILIFPTENLRASPLCRDVVYSWRFQIIFEEIRCLTWTRVVFHTENTVKRLIFSVKSLHPILIYFTWNLAGMID